MEMDHHDDFISEEEMQDEFSKAFAEKGEGQMSEQQIIQNKYFKMWYTEGEPDPKTYDHHDRIPNGGIYSCETIIDCWWQWFLSTPKQMNPYANPGIMESDKSFSSYSNANTFLFSKNNTFVYFVAGSPFQNPDFRRIVMTQQAALLVPIYNIMVSPALYTKHSDEQYVDMMKNDLKAIKKETVVARFDDQSLYGCLTIRRIPLKIFNVAKENVFDIPENRLSDTNFAIDIYHAGFWLLLKKDIFTSGDHVLYFSAQSPNYEIEEKILISALL